MALDKQHLNRSTFWSTAARLEAFRRARLYRRKELIAEARLGLHKVLLKTTKVDGMAVFRRPQQHGFVRSGSVVFSAALIMAVLVGCTPVSTVIPGTDSSPSPTRATVPSAAASQSPSPTPSADPSASASPSPSTGPDPTYTPMNLGCTDLISLEAMYDFNPNFGTDPNYAPASGSPASTIAGFDGLACGWVNQSSGETIHAAVAHLDSATLADLKKQAMTVSNPVSLYDGEGYFRSVDKVGEAQVFTGPYWLVVRSASFLEAREAKGLVDAAIGSLADQ